MDSAIEEEAFRFASLNDDDINLLIAEAKNKNTFKNTKWAVDLFNAWNHSKGNSIELIQFTAAEELGNCLAKFVVEVRKKDCSEYPPKTIYLILCGLLRHLKDNNIAGMNFLDLRDDKFMYLHKVLDGKMKELTRRGVGANIKRAAALTQADEGILWSKGMFGDSNGQAMVSTLYFYNCKLFHLRASDEHRRMKVSDISFGEDTNGIYMEFLGSSTKNNPGGIINRKKDILPKNVRYYSQPGDFDIIEIFRKYLGILHENNNVGDSPFYRRPLANNGNQVRFSKQPIGHNYLPKIIPNITAKAGIIGNFSGHSGKATGLTQLYEAQVPEQIIQQRSGNRSLESLRMYDRPRSSTSSLLASKAMANTIGLQQSGETLSISLRSEPVNEEVVEVVPKKKMLITAHGDTNVINISFQ